jgi:hypothetical protein
MSKTIQVPIYQHNNLIEMQGGIAAERYHLTSAQYTAITTVAASKLLGRGSAGGSGLMEEITLGTNLSITGTTLNAVGGSQTPWTSNINADGYTLFGNDGSGENLTLSSTSHITKGKIVFGTSVYDEVNNRLGIGTVAPSQALDIIGNMKLSGSFGNATTTTIGSLTGVTSAGNQVLTKTSHGLSLNMGDIVRITSCTTAEDVRDYVIYYQDGNQFWVQPHLTGTQSDIALTVYRNCALIDTGGRMFVNSTVGAGTGDAALNISYVGNSGDSIKVQYPSGASAQYALRFCCGNGSGGITDTLILRNDGYLNSANLATFSLGFYGPGLYNVSSTFPHISVPGVTGGNIEAHNYLNSETSGSYNVFVVKSEYNQASGTAANTDLLINRTQTAVGSGAQLLIDAQVGGVSKFSVSNVGDVNLTGVLKIDAVQVLTNRVIDARIDDTINSGDATTDGVIDAIVDCLIAHGLVAAA